MPIKSFFKKVPFVTENINNYKYYKRKALFRSIFNETGLPYRPSRKVLFYPEVPSWQNAIRAILEILNFEITNDINDKYLFAIKWHDCTYKTGEEWLKNIACAGPVINLGSRDISKKYVDQLSLEIFGYSTEIDPLTYHGRCVKKSNINSMHDGRIINCPIKKEEIQEDYIYQLLINNKVTNDYLEEFRVILYQDKIPFLFHKYKLIQNQFVSLNEKVTIKSAENVFSKPEINKLIKLPHKMGLDLAEMDVLRDQHSGRIYVIDVNDTPGALPINSAKIKKEALLKMTLAFHNTYLADLYLINN